MVNFKVCKINRGAHKFTRIPTLIIIKNYVYHVHTIILIHKNLVFSSHNHKKIIGILSINLVNIKPTTKNFKTISTKNYKPVELKRLKF